MLDLSAQSEVAGIEVQHQLLHKRFTNKTLSSKFGGHMPFIAIVDKRHALYQPALLCTGIPHPDGLNYVNRQDSWMYLFGVSPATMKLNVSLGYGPLLMGAQIYDIVFTVTERENTLRYCQYSQHLEITFD